MTEPSDDPSAAQPEELVPRLLGPLWDARRRALLEELVGRDVMVGGLYRRAVDGLGERPLTPDGLVVVGHAVRELVNRVPQMLGEFEARGDHREKAARDRLAEELTAAEPLPEIAADSRAADDVVVVPRALVSAVEDLVATHREGSSRALGLRTAFVQGTSDGGGLDATIKMVRDAVDAFERCRHTGGGPIPSQFYREPEHYLRHFEVLERVLEGRLGRFFDVAADLQVLLERANGRHGADWSAPDPEAVELVLLRLADAQHRRVFYNGLRNPRWLEPLDARRVFDDPPAHTVTPDGFMPYAAWPQGDYLHAIVAQQPAEVAKILNRVVSSDSVWNVRELVVRSAAEMPADAAVILVPQLCRVIDDRRIGPHVGLDVVSVIENLIAAGRAKQAKQLTHKLLQPRQVPDAGRTRHAVTAGIEPTWYAEALRRVVDAYEGDIALLRWLSWWLHQHQEYSGTTGPDGQDHSSLRRSSISDHEQNYRFDDIGDALVDAVRDVAVALARDESLPPVVGILRRPGTPILRRIELYVLAATVRETPDAVGIAADHLRDPVLADDFNFHRELFQLAAAALPLVDDDTYTAWEQHILAGPHLDEARRERLVEFRGGDDHDAVIAEYTDHWQHERLSAVGAESLRDPARARLAELLEKYGQHPHPGFLTWHTIGWGEEERELDTDISGLTPSQVITYMSHADAVDNSIREHDLTRAFGTDLGRRLGEYTTLASEVLTLGAPFAGQFFSTLREHVRLAAEPDDAAATPQPAAVPIDWPAVVAALTGSDVWLEHLDDDQDYSTWQWVRQEICSLLEVAARGPLPYDLFPAAAALASAMAVDTDPTPQAEAQYGGSNMDPLTHALNSVRPAAVNTLIQITRAETAARREREPETSDQSPLLTSTVVTLTQLLQPERDHSLTIAAVLGEHIGWLLSEARDWLDQHLELLASPDPFGDTFVSTTLATHHPHKAIIELLGPALSSMISRGAAGAELTSGLRDEPALEITGKHLVVLNVWGRLPIDDPLIAQYFDEAAVTVRAAVLGNLAWRFFHADELDLETRDRAAALIDSRLAAVHESGSDPHELAQFDWWVRCGHFSQEWWLPRLIDIAGRMEFEGRSHIGDELQDASRTDVAGALTALDLLVRRRSVREGVLHYGLRQAAPTVIARALEHGDNDTVQAADSLLNFIGRYADSNIENVVNERREQERRDGDISD